MESCQRWTTGPGMQVHLVTSPGHTQDRVWAGPAALTRRAAASRRRSSTSAHAPSAPADEKTAWQRAPTARQPGAGAAAHAHTWSAASSHAASPTPAGWPPLPSGEADPCLHCSEASDSWAAEPLMAL